VYAYFLAPVEDANLGGNVEITQYLAWLISFIALLRRHVLNDIYLNCFNVKQEEEPRRRAMTRGRISKTDGERVGED
jgi:hypothetical protein